MERSIFEQIRADHQQVDGLLEQLMEESHGEGRVVANEIADLLIPHAKAEEAGLYPALMEYDRARRQIEKAMAEHKEIEQQISDLARVSSGEDRDIRSHLRSLQAVIQDHVKDEESKTFGLAQELLSEAQLRDLGQRFPMDKQEYRRGFRLAA